MAEVMDFNLTERAQNALEDMTDDPLFRDEATAVELIEKEVKSRIPNFHQYLKRFINSKIGISWDEEKPVEFYRDYILKQFLGNGTPASFDPNSSTKLTAAINNWLKFRIVSRQAVLLLGFGLQMKPGDVNVLLKKGICEQEINPKDPDEVMCFYCYKYEKDYLFFEALKEQYEQIPSEVPQWESFSSDATMNIRDSMYGITGPQELFRYLARLKTSTNIPRISRAARQCFVELYHQLKEIVAEARGIAPDGVSYEMVQDWINSGTIKTKQRNLMRGDLSNLNEVFKTKRLYRLRIQELYEGKKAVTRFDLITLNFFIHAYPVDMPRLRRYNLFVEDTNNMLESCLMEGLIVQNPYEFFILGCLLSPDPIDVYACVWQRSFDGN